MAKLEKLTEGSTSYAYLATLNLANIHDALGNFSKAAHIYGQIEDNHQVDPSLRAFAGLMKIATNIRGQKLTNTEALEMIAERHRTPSFNYSRALLEASLLLDSNQKDKARALLDNLKMAEPSEYKNGLTELMMALTTK